MGASLLSRKRDLAYFINFCIGIPITFIMDLQAIYPPSMVPGFMQSLKAYYIATYNDRFFIDPPVFFELFVWSEFLIQAPIMIWALWGLYYNSPKVPLVLFPFAMLIFITTVTCMVEMLAWDTPIEQRMALAKLYSSYAAVSAVIGVDMFIRLNNMINQNTATKELKKGQ